MSIKYQRVWDTMNALDSVISKVIYAKEIILSSSRSIEYSNLKEAELLSNAAYEYLEYFIQEFDEKFKDAWKATVGDLREGDVRKEDSHTNQESFEETLVREGYEYTPLPESNKHSKYYYEYDRNDPKRKNPFVNNVTKWILPVQNDDSGELFLNLPEDLLSQLKWNIGDQLEWINNGDGTFKVIKKQ